MQTVTMKTNNVPVYTFMPQSGFGMNLYFKEGSDIPYISIDEWKDFFAMLMAMGQDYEIEFKLEKDNDKVKLIRTFGEGFDVPMMFDFSKNTISVMDYNFFFIEKKEGTMIRLHSTDEGYVRIGEQNNELVGDEILFDLSAYDISMIREEENYYVPFQTLVDIFFGEQPFTAVYNGEGVFLTTGESFYDDKGELTEYGKLFYSVAPKQRSEELGKYSYNELRLALDHFYGLKEIHGIRSFERVFQNNAYDQVLSGTDPKKADAALYQTVHYIINDQHSRYLSASPYSGADFTKQLQDRMGQGPCRSETSAIKAKLSEKRRKYYPDGIKTYEEIGDTAFITFDHFSKPSKNYSEVAPTAEDTDTVGIVSYAMSQILRENSPIRNVVLDLSQNLGGAAPAAGFVISAFLGDAYLSVRDSLTGACGTYAYKSDSNFDRQFDEKDTLANKDLRLFCLTSKVSFSCGNLVPCIFKQNGDIALIGHRTGGGACGITPISTADGSVFRTSSNIQLSFLRNGSFYDVDQGVDPDYYIHDLGFLYDRKGLVEYIKGLK
jgi:hypothetical protein